MVCPTLKGDGAIYLVNNMHVDQCTQPVPSSFTYIPFKPKAPTHLNRPRVIHVRMCACTSFEVDIEEMEGVQGEKLATLEAEIESVWGSVRSLNPVTSAAAARKPFTMRTYVEPPTALHRPASNSPLHNLYADVRLRVSCEYVRGSSPVAFTRRYEFVATSRTIAGVPNPMASKVTSAPRNERQ